MPRSHTHARRAEAERSSRRRRKAKSKQYRAAQRRLKGKVAMHSEEPA